MKTVDGGQSWQLLPSLAGSTPMGGAAAVAFPSESIGYVADVQDRLFRTTNGGQSWSIVAQRSFGSFYGLHFTDAQTGYGVGFDGNLRRTTDGGVTWTVQSLNQVDTYSAVYFPTAQVGYAAGSDAGAGARILKYTPAISGTTGNSLPGISVFPNPASRAVQLTGLPAGQPTRATIFSADGRRVSEKVLTGASTTELETANLAAGLYVLRLEAGGRSYQQKLLISQ